MYPQTVQPLKTRRGHPSPNQVVLKTQLPSTIHSQLYSYGELAAEKWISTQGDMKGTLYKGVWDFSRTTTHYVCQFFEVPSKKALLTLVSKGLITLSESKRPLHRSPSSPLRTYKIRLFWDRYPDLTSIVEVEATSEKEAYSIVFGMCGTFYFEQGGSGSMGFPTDAEILEGSPHA